MTAFETGTVNALTDDIPIVFSTDGNYVAPTYAAMSSALRNAEGESFYSLCESDLELVFSKTVFRVAILRKLPS
jgi:hypothetical protein